MKKWVFILLIGFMFLGFNLATAFFYGIANWKLPTWDVVPVLLRITFAQSCAFAVLYLAVNGLLNWAKGKPKQDL
ncbi:hypothetical protein ID850_18250 [Xenorhabdus sp. Flor]|uniref:hypothetical protein n=1 Tax=Xenorhabdus cabanillasii TaxID=351673 RepID=UPI00198F9BB3|nr:hypothetical protein [Xenorhabdus sp. Flor]MBD2816633.1 hypothetical protein [Xenorhabdus sp. Flor]